METIQNREENSYDDELSYQGEHWKTPTAHKKRKIIPGPSAMETSHTEKQQWVQDILLRNLFGLVIEEINTDPKEKVAIHIVKPPPIYIDAQIIDPLIELLNNTAGEENYSIKQLKLKEAKVQTKTLEIFRKVTQGEKRWVSYIPAQNKKSYKIVIRGLHPRTNIKKYMRRISRNKTPSKNNK